MSWAKWIFAYIFDCAHLKTTWPQRGRTGLDYVCCLDCGREFPYSTQLMCVVKRNNSRIEISTVGRSSITSDPHIARSSAKLSIDTLIH